MLKPYLFTPSEFAFGLSGCKKCYYDLKINKIKIQTGFPQIFSKLDSEVSVIIWSKNLTYSS